MVQDIDYFFGTVGQEKKPMLQSILQPAITDISIDSSEDEIRTTLTFRGQLSALSQLIDRVVAEEKAKQGDGSDE